MEGINDEWWMICFQVHDIRGVAMPVLKILEWIDLQLMTKITTHPQVVVEGKKWEKNNNPRKSNGEVKWCANNSLKFKNWT